LVTTALDTGVVVPEPAAEVPVPLEELPEPEPLDEPEPDAAEPEPELEPEPLAEEPLPELEPAFEPLELDPLELDPLELELDPLEPDPVVVSWVPLEVEPLAEVPVPLDELLDDDGAGVETGVPVEPELLTKLVEPEFSEPRFELSAAAASIPYLAEAAMIPTETTLRIDFVVLLTRQTPLSESVPLGFQRASGSFRPSWSMHPDHR
jgi:hypothetical protein